MTPSQESPSKPEAAIEEPPAEDVAARARARAAEAEAEAEAERTAKLRGRLAEKRAYMKKRGILPEDLKGYGPMMEDFEAAISRGDHAEATTILLRYERVVVATNVDGPFVSRKLERISALLEDHKSRSEAEEVLASLLSQVHAAYFAHRYVRANQYLNEMWRMIRAGGRTE